MSESPPTDLQARILALLDGALDRDDAARLDAELCASREARDLFRQLAALHSALEDQGASKADVRRMKPLIPMDRVLVDQRRQMVRTSLLAAAAVMALLALVLWFKMVPRTPVTFADFRLGPDSAFILTHAGEKDTPVGQVLGTGSRLRLSSGTMEAVFESGVRCVIEAPCDLTVLAEDRIVVRQGVAWFEVPPPAVGFTVETPQLTVVDLGTEFGIVALADARHEIHVTKGSVEAAAPKSGQTDVLKAGQARRADARGGFAEIDPEPSRFTTALPEAISILNPSFEMDENPSEIGEFQEGERGDFGMELSGWISQSGSPYQVSIGWRGVRAEQLHPYPPAAGRNSQALSLISGGSVLNVTGKPWSSLRAGDTLTLTISLGLRTDQPALNWNEGTFFGLTDGDFSPSDVPTPAETVIHSGLIAENPATGSQSGNGTFADVPLEYTVQPADLERPGRVGILLVGDSNQRGNSLHQSFFDNVRLHLTPVPESR